MSAAQPGIPADQPSTEAKVEDAIVKASAIVASFNPQAAAVIQAGAAVEPVMHGLLQMFIALFRHHVSQPAAQ